MYPVVSDKRGRIKRETGFVSVAQSGNMFIELESSDMIPLPEGAGLVMLPGRKAIGIRRRNGEFESLKGMPVAATLPQGYTRLFLPAYTERDDAPVLPLFGYTAVAEKDGQFFAAAVKTDDPDRWNPVYFNTPDIRSLVKQKLDKYPKNRILRQLSHCALQYGCFTAQNIFYSRWEGGIPISPVCNARCIGCISEQVSECRPSPQQRIKFIPTPDEVAEVALAHLVHGDSPIVSFGQGCEGEPTMQPRVLADSIAKIRQLCDRGTVNLNTNGSRPQVVKELISAGLDSIRISTIGAVEETYNAYYRPKSYRLSDVFDTMKLCKYEGIFTSLNLLTFPGFTDTPREFDALCGLIHDIRPDMIQFRNLNIDPRYFINLMGVESPPIGIAEMIDTLKTEFPNLKLGNYTPGV